MANFPIFYCHIPHGTLSARLRYLLNLQINILYDSYIMLYESYIFLYKSCKICMIHTNLWISIKKKILVYKICMPPFIHMIHTKYGSLKSYICMIHTYFAWIHSYKSMIRTKICMIHTSVCMNDTKCMIWRCCRYTSAQSFSYNLKAIIKCK